MTCERVLLTPELAKQWVATTPPEKQRRVNTSWRKYLGLEMAESRWDEQNGDTFTFDTNGYLADGQHRALAVIESGVSIWVWVMRGANPMAILTKDQSFRRTVGQTLGILHPEMKYKKDVAAALVWLLRYESRKKGVLGAQGRVPQSIQLSCLDQHAGLYHSVVKAAKALGQPPVVRRHIAAFVHYAAIQARPEDGPKADAFLEAVGTGVHLGPESPILALYRRLRTVVAAKPQPGRDVVAVRDQICLLVVKAWHYFRNDKTTTKLFATGKFPNF